MIKRSNFHLIFIIISVQFCHEKRFERCTSAPKTQQKSGKLVPLKDEHDNIQGAVLMKNFVVKRSSFLVTWLLGYLVTLRYHSGDGADEN